ncbi:MAG: phosphatidate cytidylyltransferase, partial [Chloroflexota bacterium]|nr:phosphatidate cytidylyltransferase [Chloroflexota bacterium]
MSYDASEPSALPSRRGQRSARQQPAPRDAASRAPDEPGAPANTSTTDANARWQANLRVRLGSAAVLIALVVSIIFFGGWIAFLGAFGFLCIGAWEMSAMLAHRGWRPQMIISIALGTDFLFAAMFPEQRLLIIAGGISASLVLSFTAFLFGGESFENALRDWALTLAIPLYLGWPLALFVALRGSAFGLGSTGFWWVIAVFAMVWGNDSGAYLTGHYLGKTKMSPRVSPNKTWEGFAGGLLVSVAAAFVFGIPLHLPWYAALTMGIFTAIASTFGDLAESLLKRGAGVKDSGQL